MVRIFHNKSGDFVVQTTCLDAETFAAELSEALVSFSHRNAAYSGEESADECALAFMGIMKNAMPIMFKLSGYKAESVSEQRTLLCGTLLPNESEVVASVGR